MRPLIRMNPVLAGAVGFSLVFHLSMVTLFQIVIFFPRQDIDYFMFSIVDPRSQRAAFALAPGQLKVPSAEGALDRLDSDFEREGAGRFFDTLPFVDLPTLEFAELDMLRAGVKGLQIRSKYRELFQQGQQDTWALLGQKLGSVGDALAWMAGVGQEEEAPLSSGRIAQPAPGFAAYLEWMDAPKDRRPVSVAKVEALWGHPPSELAEAILLVFKVNREGQVVYVLPQALDDDAGIVDGAARALLKYRFEALGEEGPAAQYGTLLIRAEEGAE